MTVTEPPRFVAHGRDPTAGYGRVERRHRAALGRGGGGRAMTHIARDPGGYVLPICDQPWFDGSRTPKELIVA